MKKRFKCLFICLLFVSLAVFIALAICSAKIMGEYEKYVGLELSQLPQIYYNARFMLIASLFAVVVVVALTIVTLLKPTFIMISLTPEQAAERKRIIAERKKAKLQEKLNKLQ